MDSKVVQKNLEKARIITSAAFHNRTVLSKEDVAR